MVYENDGTRVRHPVLTYHKPTQNPTKGDKNVDDTKAIYNIHPAACKS